MTATKHRHSGDGFLKRVWLFRKSIPLVICPFLLSPLLLVNPTSETKCAYGVLLISVYWITGALPPFVTALLPVGIFPILGLQKAKEISRHYFNDVAFLALGAGLTAGFIQSRSLHQRLALSIISKTKATPFCLALSVWGCSALLSAFISKSAVITMMSPIALSICRQLSETQRNDQQEDLQHLSEDEIDIEEHPDQTRLNKIPEEHLVKAENFKKGLFLGFIYSSRVGSLVLLTGSLTTIVLKCQVDFLFGLDSRVTVLSWFLFACPLCLLSLAFIWLWLYIRYVRQVSCMVNGFSSDRKAALNQVVHNEYSKLTPLKLADCIVLGYSLVLVILWSSRDVWAPLFDRQVTDSLPALLATVLLVSTPGLMQVTSNKGASGHVSRCSRVDWPSMQKLFPWTSLFMIGSGAAMANVYQLSGLAETVSSSLTGSITLPSLTAAILLAALTSLLAESVCGTVLSNLILPFIANLAMSLDINPLYYMLVVSVSSSLGFISPVSRILHDLISEYAPRVSNIELIVSGLVVKVLCLLMVILAMNTWAGRVLKLDTPLDWTRMIRHGTVENFTLISCNATQFQ